MVIRVLVILQLSSDAIDDIRNGKVATNGLDIVNGIRPKQSLQDARHKINHDDTALFSENHSKLAEDFHSLLVHDQFRSFTDRRTFGLNVLSKAGGQFENGVFSDM